MEFTNWAAWLAGAVAVVGITQYLKGFAKEAPSWVWLAVMPVLAIGTAWAAGGARPWYDALGIVAIAQLGYELIVQGVKRNLGGTP